MVEEVLQQHPKPVQDYLSGKEAAIGFLIGQVMRATKGQADPGVVRSLLQEALSRLRK